MKTPRTGSPRVVALALLLGAALASIPASGSPAAAPGGDRRHVLAEFADLLSIPNVASDRENIERNARWIAERFAARGLATKLLRAPADDAPPAVLARLDRPGATRTITFYAHYDGQPVEPKEWKTPPYQPTLRSDGQVIPIAGEGPVPDDARLFARSAGDDKMPIVAFLAALDRLKAEGRTPAFDLHFLFEGEEEAGSPHLAAILAANAADVATDLWVLCDGPAHQSGRPLLFFGARGTTDLELTVYGPNRGLHSGHYGNWAPNPIVELTHLLDSMRDEDGRILIAHYEDAVRPLGAAERAALEAAPRVDEEVARTFAIGRTESPGASLLEAIQRPALNVRGIASGHVGATASNTIQPEASASIDFRLVPDQTPEGVRRLVEAHVAAQGYFLVTAPPDDATRRAHPRIAKLEWSPGYAGFRTPMDLPAARALAALVAQGAGQPIVELPMLGGSIPMPIFSGRAGTPVVGLSLANFDDNQHAPDENLLLANLWRAIDVYSAVFAGL